MFPSSAADSRYAPRPWRQLLDFFALTVLFCALMSAILTLAGQPSAAAFARYLLITECVGIAAVTCGSAISRLPWLQRFSPLVAHFVISAASIPIGYTAGSSLAFTLLGEPIPLFDPGPRRIIAIVATALATVFIVYLDEMRHRFALETAARSEAQRLAIESQLRLLRAQLEPHMLFNTLANLRSLVEVDARLAQSMIDQLIVYLRSALAASRTETTTLRNEFAQLHAYLEIMSLRMGPRLTYRLELPEALQLTAIPPMLLQPLVENAIKHGIEPQIGNGSIAVSASRSNETLEISVSDSGLGLPAEGDGDEPDAGNRPAGGAAGANGGYGLVHVRARLQAFYGAQASLTLAPQHPHGARAIVRIPL